MMATWINSRLIICTESVINKVSTQDNNVKKKLNLKEGEIWRDSSPSFFVK